MSKEWIDFDAERFFRDGLGRNIVFVNDADAAGVAEARHGAARDVRGFTLLTTLGTGIGSAFLYDGVLLPNTELGHLNFGEYESVETYAATSAREREGLSWAAWAERLQAFYSHIEFLFSPDLFVVGGGVSKNAGDFLPLLDLKTPIVPPSIATTPGSSARRRSPATDPHPLLNLEGPDDSAVIGAFVMSRAAWTNPSRPVSGAPCEPRGGAGSDRDGELRVGGQRLQH